MRKTYILTKSKYIRGLQCEKALHLEVNKPKLAKYPPETLERFQHGRDFEKSFKDTFPHGTDISSLLGFRMDAYPTRTAALLQKIGAATLFEAGFLFDEILILADVVDKHADGTIDIYEVKNSTAVSDTFRNDLAIQYHVVHNALNAVQPHGLFNQHLTIRHFYIVYNNGQDGFVKEDLLEQAISAGETIETNIVRFKKVLAGSEPSRPMGAHCTTPYECPFQHYCNTLAQ